MTFLVSDVGGTNVRFALADGPSSPLTDIHSLKCADFAEIGDAFTAYLATLDADVAARVEAVAIAVAAPVNARMVNVTNNHWCFDKPDLLAALPGNRLLVVNDFTAQALAQADPCAHGNVQLLAGTPDPKAPLLVIGPGTGLGVSALIPSADGFVPIEGEGGHISFAPRSDAERALDAFIRMESDYVSVEHFVSGAGLENIYRFLTSTNGESGTLNAPEIGALAVSEDGIARAAAMMLLGILGTVIANNILTFGCWRGAVIAGGIVPKLAPLIEASPLAHRIRNIGSYTELMADIPVWLAPDPYAGLRGAQAGLVNAHLAPRSLTV